MYDLLIMILFLTCNDTEFLLHVVNMESKICLEDVRHLTSHRMEISFEFYNQE